MSEKADEIRGLRRDFAAPGSRHDSVVRWLRIILPVCIGALGALLALAPLTMTGDVSFVLAKEEVAVAKERMRVREALYRGEDSKGQPFSLKAGSAVQHSSKVPIVELEDLQARILLKDGPAVLRANEGQYDMDKEDVIVSGPIQFEAAGGYRLSTQDVTVDLDGKTLKSDAPVYGRTNLGTFKANRLKADLTDRTVVLEGGASLRIEQNGIKAR